MLKFRQKSASNNLDSGWPPPPLDNVQIKADFLTGLLPLPWRCSAPGAQFQGAAPRFVLRAAAFPRGA